MYLKEKTTGKSVEVLYLSELFSLHDTDIQCRYQVGDEVLVTDIFNKSDLEFTSGEPLPNCWSDPHYRDHELKRRQ